MKQQYWQEKEKGTKIIAQLMYRSKLDMAIRQLPLNAIGACVMASRHDVKSSDVQEPMRFDVTGLSPYFDFRLVRLHAAPQRSAATWQKQCILVRTFVRLWLALPPPYDHMCHQSTARAKRDQPPRSGAAVAQNRLRKPWWWLICVFITVKAFLV